MILRVVRESESGELAVEVREFEEPFPMEEVCGVVEEALADAEILRGVLGIAVVFQGGLAGDWLLRPQWWAESPAEVARLLAFEVDSARERGAWVQKVFVWAPSPDSSLESVGKLLWLLSGGVIWLAGSPSSDEESPYPHHARQAVWTYPNSMIDLYRRTPGSRWAPKSEEKVEPKQGELEL